MYFALNVHDYVERVVADYFAAEFERIVDDDIVAVVVVAAAAAAAAVAAAFFFCFQYLMQ